MFMKDPYVSSLHRKLESLIISGLNYRIEVIGVSKWSKFSIYSWIRLLLAFSSVQLRNCSSVSAILMSQGW